MRILGVGFWERAKGGKFKKGMVREGDGRRFEAAK
jgi:hypothetical protein